MEALREFHRDVVDIYGYGLQVSAALAQWHQIFANQISRGYTSADKELLFGKGNPNNPDAKFVYRKTVGHLMSASDTNGRTTMVHRRNLIVLLSAAWEDRHRYKIAEDAGLSNERELKSDVFRDIKLFRNSITHGGKIKNHPRVFCFFEKGGLVIPTKGHVDVIFRESVDELSRIEKKYFRVGVHFNFETSLYTQHS